MSATATKTDAATVVGIDLAGYLVADPQAAVAFYRDKLGMTPTATDEGGRGAEFTLADGSTFGVWKPDDGARGGFVMLAHDDLKSAVATYRARRLEVSDPFETPVCYMAFTKDPEGNGIILHQRKA